MKILKEKRTGFTLLEVLLSLALFSIIALTTIKQITLIRNTKDAAFRDIDAYSNARAALNAMETDIRQAFHILLVDLGTFAATRLSRNIPVAHTLIDGKKSELVLTTLSHRNYFTENRESEQTEISFQLQNSKTSKYSTLVKREAELIDEKPYEGGKTYTLLENVVSLEFKYFDPKSGKWQDAWNSDEGAFRDKFPTSIKILVEVAGERSKPIKVETSFKVSFPNNEPILVTF